MLPVTKLHDALRARIAEHFELLLTAAGVLLAVVLTWAVRRHSRLGQARLIRKLRVMLQDRVHNQLTVLVGVAELRGQETGSPRVWEDRYVRHLPAPLR